MGFFLVFFLFEGFTLGAWGGLCNLIMILSGPFHIK